MSVLAALMATAAPPVRAETPQVKIAHQADRDSGRLVLDFGRPVEYAVERAEPYTFMRFSQPVSGDLEAAQRALSRYITELRLAGGGRVLVMRVAGQPRMTHYRRGNAVVIAWVGAGPPAPATAEKPAEAKPPQNDSAAKPPEPKITEKPATPPSKPAEKPVAEKPAAEKPASEKPAPEKPAAEKPAAGPPKTAEAPKSPDPKITEKPSPPRAETPAPPVKPRQEAKRPEAEPAKPGPPAKAGPNGSQPSAATPDSPGPTVGPALTVSNDGAETRIAVAWPEPIGAAVFRYGDTVWMVFSRRQAFDVAPYQKRLGPGVERLARIEHAQATVLAARLRAGMGARVLRDRNVWTVAFKRDQPASGDNDPKVAIAITRGAAEQVTVPLAGAETPIRLADPELGGTVFVVPSRAQAAGAGERRFVTFRLLPAVQGAVVEALADGLAVSAEGASVVIRRSGGLLLSGGPPPGAPTQGQ